MRLLIGICLLVSLKAHAQPQRYYYNGPDEWVWLTLYYGPGTNSDYTMSVGGASMTYTNGNHAFDAKYRIASEIKPPSNTIDLWSNPPPKLKPDVVHSFNFQYGISLTKRWLRFNAGAGLGYSFGKRAVVLTQEEADANPSNFHYYNSNGEEIGLKKFNALNIPIDVDLQFLLGHMFALELNAFFDIRNTMPAYGATFGIIFGELR